jgi:hypothetical protein
MVTVADIADTMHGVQRRAMMEKVFTEGSFIEAQITVQGWFRQQHQRRHVTGPLPGRADIFAPATASSTFTARCGGPA